MANIEKIINEVKKNIVRLTFEAGNKGAHVGSSLSLAEILTVLFVEHFNSETDKFILSKGHGGLGYYAVLYAVGEITKEQLNTFEKNGGDFPGQPSRQPDNRILYSSGSLGMGLSYGVGYAWSMKHKKEKGKVFVVLGDGELDEGNIWEAVMLAKQQALSNLIAVVDWNNMQSDGNTKHILDLDLKSIWSAFGWRVIECDGHSVEELRNAYIRAEGLGPAVILAKTVKGKGISFMENNKIWHHNHLTEKQYKMALEELEKTYGI